MYEDNIKKWWKIQYLTSKLPILWSWLVSGSTTTTVEETSRHTPHNFCLESLPKHPLCQAERHISSDAHHLGNITFHLLLALLPLERGTATPTAGPGSCRDRHMASGQEEMGDKGAPQKGPEEDLRKQKWLTHSWFFMRKEHDKNMYNEAFHGCGTFKFKGLLRDLRDECPDSIVWGSWNFYKVTTIS